LLTVLYFGIKERTVILSKGHAAPLQYACLYGTGRLTAEQLFTYKDGPEGLQAHTDIRTAGIFVNTGSLGQSLSKAAGIAWARPRERVYVILGDGELQEGQNFEALQTIAHLELNNLTVILDQNGFQTELRVDEVKGVPDYRRVFSGFGLSVVDVNGHDPAQLLAALQLKTGRPKGIIARTRKAAGSKYLGAIRGRQPWHAGVPDYHLYLKILAEQVSLTEDPELGREFEDFQRLAAQMSVGPAAPRGYGSTRDWYAEELAGLAKKHANLVVLDADLAKSCGLQNFAQNRSQFVELGISEQDMVSFAGGLALSGKLPVVNTYAAFFKRAYEQICINQSEGKKIIYAGHYAGLCYYTDGKTHQSINDLSLMRTVPGLTVIEPVDEQQVRYYLRWAVTAAQGSVYFRLRRTPAEIRLGKGPALERPVVVGRAFDRAFIVEGTVATGLALCARREEEFADYGLIIQSVFNFPLDLAYYRRMLGPVRDLIVIEDNIEAGGLYEFVCSLLMRLGVNPRVRNLSLHDTGWSFRTLGDCLDYNGFTLRGLKALSRCDKLGTNHRTGGERGTERS
jgi:transketolase